MKVETGNFDIPVRTVGRNPGKYAKSFHVFKDGDMPALKYTFETEKEARNCVHSLWVLIKHEKGDRFRVIKRGLDVFVLRRDDRADKESEG